MLQLKSKLPKTKYDGRWVAEGFQYPHSLVLGDNLWIIYSVGKEDVQLTRTPISDIVNLGSIQQ